MARAVRLVVPTVVLGLMLGSVGVPAAEVPPEQTGLAVGTKAPAMVLQDQAGKEVALADLLKKGPVAVVFHRSADW